MIKEENTSRFSISP